MDSVQMPVNPLEAASRRIHRTSSLQPEKPRLNYLGNEGAGRVPPHPLQGSITPEILVRFALNERIRVAVVSCSTPAEVDALARMGEGHEGDVARRKKALVEAFRP